MASEHVKRFSASLVVRETQVKTATRDHLAPIRKAAIGKRKISVEELEPTCAVAGNVKWGS